MPISTAVTGSSAQGVRSYKRVSRGSKNEYKKKERKIFRDTERNYNLSFLHAAHLRKTHNQKKLITVCVFGDARNYRLYVCINDRPQRAALSFDVSRSLYQSLVCN